MHLIFIVIFIIIVLNVLSWLAKKGVAARGKSSSGAPRPFAGNIPRSRFRAVIDREAWMNAAGELGLSFVRPTESSGGMPSIHGRIENFMIDISGKENPPETVYRIAFPENIDLGFLAMKDPDDTVLARFFSGRKHFEKWKNLLPDTLKNAAVSAYEEKGLSRYLTAARRDALKRCLELYQNVIIDDNSIQVTYPGIDSDPAKICARVYTALEFAKILGCNVSAGEPEIAMPNPAPAEKTPEPEFPKPESVQDAPEEIHESQKELESPASSVPAAEETVSDLLKQDILLPSLFGATFAGAKEKELFESVKGREIHWTGTVKSVYDFSSDFVFGSGGGAKTTLELMELTGAYSMKTKIKAVVCFPKDKTAELRSLTGKEIRFRGILFKAEAFAKEVYISQGMME